MASLIEASDSGDDPIEAEDLNQIIRMLNGQGNYPASITGVNDPTNYAGDFQNNDATNDRVIRARDADGNVLLRVDASGVVASPDTDGSAAAKVVTVSHPQTLTQKTFTAPVINLGSDAEGDLYYRDGEGEFARLPAGTAKQLLRMNSAAEAPEWVTHAWESSSGGTATLGNVSADAPGSLYVITSDAQTITLPSAAANPNKQILVKLAYAGTATVQRAGSDTIWEAIAGVTSLTLQAGWSQTFQSLGGTVWYAV